MPIVGSFDTSPGKPAFNLTVNGTSALDDSIQINTTASATFIDVRVSGANIIYDTFIYEDGIISSLVLPGFNSANFIESIDRTGSSNSMYNINYKITNILDNSNLDNAMYIIGGDDSDLMRSPLSKISILHGGIGNDEIYGGNVTNIVYGGPGSNSLYGGAGDDIYRAFTPDKTVDEIIDSTGIDRIQVLLPATMGNTYNHWYKRVGNDLIGNIRDNEGGSYKFTVKNQYSFTGGIETIQIYAMGSSTSLPVRAGNFDTQATNSQTYYHAGTDNSEFIRITGLGSEKKTAAAWGNGGNDTMIRTETIQKMDFIGGDGIDTMEYLGLRSDYTITNSSNPYTKQITSLVQKNSATDKTISDYILAERIAFSDVAVALDINGNAGSVAKILATVFGKEAISNKVYAGIGLQLMDSGMSYLELADLAINLGGPTNSQIVESLWNNLYGTEPSEITKLSLVGLLDSKGMTAGALAFVACELNSNIDLVGLAATGLEYIQQG